MKRYLILLLKGFGMGAANVIPGVSGGTIALVTGIYEQLINSLKSFDLKAVKLLLSGNFKNFIEHTHLKFLVSVFSGTALSIVTLAKVLEFFFSKNWPRQAHYRALRNMRALSGDYGRPPCGCAGNGCGQPNRR